MFSWCWKDQIHNEKVALTISHPRLGTLGSEMPSYCNKDWIQDISVAVSASDLYSELVKQ